MHTTRRLVPMNFPAPFGLSLSKPFVITQDRPFDKLRANGFTQHGAIQK